MINSLDDIKNAIISGKDPWHKISNEILNYLDRRDMLWLVTCTQFMAVVRSASVSGALTNCGLNADCMYDASVLELDPGDLNMPYENAGQPDVILRKAT